MKKKTHSSLPRAASIHVSVQLSRNPNWIHGITRCVAKTNIDSVKQTLFDLNFFLTDKIFQAVKCIYSQSSEPSPGHNIMSSCN